MVHDFSPRITRYDVDALNIDARVENTKGKHKL